MFVLGEFIANAIFDEFRAINSHDRTREEQQRTAMIFTKILATQCLEKFNGEAVDIRKILNPQYYRLSACSAIVKSFILAGGPDLFVSRIQQMRKSIRDTNFLSLDGELRLNAVKGAFSYVLGSLDAVNWVSAHYTLAPNHPYHAIQKPATAVILHMISILLLTPPLFEDRVFASDGYLEYRCLKEFDRLFAKSIKTFASCPGQQECRRDELAAVNNGFCIWWPSIATPEQLENNTLSAYHDMFIRSIIFAWLQNMPTLKLKIVNVNRGEE